MSKRLFSIHTVTKPGQSNTDTKYNIQGSVPTYTGTPDRAARKAMTYLCGRMSKKIKGRCTLTISVIEVKERVIDGEKMMIPKLDKDDLPYIMKYKIKRMKLEDGGREVDMSDTTISFKYETKIIESFGRVL